MSQQIGLENDEEHKIMWVASILVRTGLWEVSKRYESLDELAKHVDEYVAMHPNATVNIYGRRYYD